MITDNGNLFSAFDPVSKKNWKDAIIADLKGADYEKKLIWKTDEEIDVQPFYTEEDLHNMAGIAHQTPLATRRWTNFAEADTCDQHEANKFILRMIEFDVKGFLLNIKDPEKIRFNILLNGIDPAGIEIAFKLQKPSPELILRYFAFLEFENVSLSDICGFVQSDVLEEWSVTGQNAGFTLLAEQLKITSQAKNFRGLMLSSHAFVNAGSGIVQESAFLLSKLTDTIEMLERSGLAREQILPELCLHMAISGDYFFEIAKLRAIRPVISAILKCYAGSVPYVPVLSSNSAWSKALYDPTVNILRNTTEAMSAILGGCDAILVNPHDSTYKNPDEFSHRIAVNISNLLKEESYFGKVTDPAAGSYYLEAVTAGLTEKILRLFQETEANGGYIESFKKGLIQEKISALKHKKEGEIASRKKVYVGMNKYVNLKEEISLTHENIPHQDDAGFPLLRRQRATKNFEYLRQRTQRHFLSTGETCKVYLACFGDHVMRRARAAFASEFFGTAGFEIAGEYFFEEVKKAAEASAKSNSNIVVMCSSDAAYETVGKEFAETFRSFSPNKKLILAGYPAAIIKPLNEAGIDDFIHIKTNVVEFVSAMQNELFGAK